MAIGIRELYFLKYISKKIPFNSVATIGRQKISIDPKKIKEILNTNKNYVGYCEDLLINEFNATKVDSYDADDYEGANNIYDFNKEFNNNKVYDLVLDIGSMEHIFDIHQSIKNISKLCKLDGHIVHINPSNNFAGHGLYQFGVDFYASLYRKKNGFENTEIFLTEYRTKDNYYYSDPDKNYWYKAVNLYNGEEKLIQVNMVLCA